MQTVKSITQIIKRLYNVNLILKNKTSSPSNKNKKYKEF